MSTASNTPKTLPINLKDIQDARTRIAPYIRKTPLLAFDYLNRSLGKNILLKTENLQITGSFKIRGAANCILENMTQAKKNGVVAASAGNHAQGVAAICHQLGIKSTIVMPTTTPHIKLQNTESWGAKAILHGGVYDESFEHAKSLAEKESYVFIHPFRDPKIMAGQGTVALELLDEKAFQNCEAVVISIGGGGLITGVATALKALKPGIKIYGVTSAHAPAAWKSFKAGTPIREAVKFTLAEGVATKGPDAFMLDCLKASVDEVFTISEESIAHAISILAEHGKMVVEGAGALPLAAILENLIPEKNITAVLSGGNIDLPALSSVLQRGLVEQGRLVRLIITVVDRPGGLNALTTILAESGANILQIHHQRATLHTHVGEAEVEADLETRGLKHTNDIIALLQNRGFKVQRVS